MRALPFASLGTRGVRYIMLLLHLCMVLSSTGSAFTTASQNHPNSGLGATSVPPMPNGGASAALNSLPVNGTLPAKTGSKSMSLEPQPHFAEYEQNAGQHQLQTAFTTTSSTAGERRERGPLKILFLSADTGGGHRASAEALAKQFQLHYPGSTYDLLDVWTNDGVYPYRTLVNTYKHLSSHPRQWRLFYHLSNTNLNELMSNTHATVTCEKKIRSRIASYDPDMIVSVHPTMNYTPLISAKHISKELGRHIPFFTVITDFGSGHRMWFQRKVDKMYVASEPLRRIARRRGTPDDKIVMSGLPIRHNFALEAEQMGCRTSELGKQYQYQRKTELGLDPEKKMVLVMGGGEGVGSLSDIVNELYTKFTEQGVDASICVVCGRNEKLKKSFESRSWDAVLAGNYKPKRRRDRVWDWLRRRHRSRKIQAARDRAEHTDLIEPDAPGEVDVVPLGFVTEMAGYMAAADVLVSKAGPGTIAEAAAVGLPIMLTSYLPGQEAGNVDLVLENGFGDFSKDPDFIAREVACWLQDEALLHELSLAAQKVGHPNAASEIVQSIGDITQTWLELNGPTEAFA